MGSGIYSDYVALEHFKVTSARVVAHTRPILILQVHLRQNHSPPLPLVIDHLCFSLGHGLSEPHLLPASLDVILPIGCGRHSLGISLGAVQEAGSTLGVPSKMRLNNEVGT